MAARLNLNQRLGQTERLRNRSFALLTRYPMEGIDTPELRSSSPDERERAKAAKSRVVELCPVDSTVWIYTEKTGKYGRYIGRIYLTEIATVSLNEMLVDEGHAVLMD